MEPMIEPTTPRSTPAWPEANLDAVRRLHALAAGIPGAALLETVIPAPFAAVWNLAADLERAVPESEWHVRSLRITRRDGDRVEALVVGLAGARDRFVGVLRPGWCLLQGRLLWIGMAATSEARGTRIALAAGLRVPGAVALMPLVRRGVARSLRRLAERVADE